MNFKKISTAAIASMGLFALGIIIFMLSGTDGHTETMNTVSYIGVGLSFSVVLYMIFGGLISELFKSKTDNGK